MINKKQTIKIPKTGKIGTLFRNIERETNQFVVLEIVQDMDQFESALNKPVEVELIQSVITGAEKCKFLIHY